MMVNRPLPQINEAINFLAKNRPSSLRELSGALPDLEDRGLLKPGRILGKEDSPQLLRSLADAMVRSLTGQIESLDAQLPRVKRSIKMRRIVRLVGEVGAVAGSASVVSFLAAELVEGSLVSGIIALIASLSAVLVDFFGQSDDPDVGLQQLYFELAATRVRSQQIVTQLRVRIERFDVADEWNTAVCDKLVREGNEVSGCVNALLAKIPS
ncbi:MAG: hypothetical protein KJZ69_01910 [Phycisphaerales bacterium]|nr:hypothetical protein [Phycisphaerales bacterium]